MSDLMDEVTADGADIEGRRVRNPLHGLLGGNRLLYKRILTVSRGTSEEEQRLHELLIAKRGEPSSTSCGRLTRSSRTP
jgi:hypothetical protein